MFEQTFKNIDDILHKDADIGTGTAKLLNLIGIMKTDLLF